MNIIADNLCVHDKRSSSYADIHAYDDPDEIPAPRINCFCDNCFYGRDRLAVELENNRQKIDRFLELHLASIEERRSLGTTSRLGRAIDACDKLNEDF